MLRVSSYIMVVACFGGLYDCVKEDKMKKTNLACYIGLLFALLVLVGCDNIVLPADNLSSEIIDGDASTAILVEQSTFDVGISLDETSVKGLTGSTSFSLDPAYTKVVNGSSFKIRATISSSGSTGSHYVNLTLKAPTGYSPKSRSISIAHLYSGSPKTYEFSFTAPNRDSTGVFSYQATWSSQVSGKGTNLSKNGGIVISSDKGWTFSAQLINPGWLVTGEDDTVWTITNSWRYIASMSSRNPPYLAKFVIPSVPATYSVSALWTVFGGGYGNRRWSKEKTVKITKSGQSIVF